MDVILDANAYIRVLHNHGRGSLQTNQFAELLTYLRRTSSRLVIPELTYNEVVARYGERLTAVTKAARDAWSTLQQVGMQKRIDFLEPDIKSELASLGELLYRPGPGVESVMYTDYSGINVKEVARRGVGRVRPANDKGEELRDVILWLIVLHYAKQSKASIAFVSEDKTFQHTDGTLHPTLQRDVERAGVSVAFYRSVGDFVKGNALESESFEHAAIAAYVIDDEVRGIATEQLLGSRLWNGTIVGAEVLRCDVAEARRYRVGEDSYYVEARYTGEATIQISLTNLSAFYGEAVSNQTFVTPHHATATLAIPLDTPPVEGTGWWGGLPPFRENLAVSSIAVPTRTTKTYRCRFELRLSLRIVADKRESLEVDEFVLLGELVPLTTGDS